jgi:hypothetical protein
MNKELSQMKLQLERNQTVFFEFQSMNKDKMFVIQKDINNLFLVEEWNPLNERKGSEEYYLTWPQIKTRFQKLSSTYNLKNFGVID